MTTYDHLFDHNGRLLSLCIVVRHHGESEEYQRFHREHLVVFGGAYTVEGISIPPASTRRTAVDSDIKCIIMHGNPLDALWIAVFCFPKGRLCPTFPGSP
ncbi:hypothetical protein LJC74_09455 [Eubacteriales bacterium OttesenSCG-928-A19]|nr:hypothetical protein [Eubacteriales bacterium OttesenSCG-928-A19]